ncbi:DUF2716 domain-containing protein [Roseibacillus persicicus]|uniref:DUF2716 domain-containing protein n=1 Tax=Roseibacillus persicicus TaxID=454148 RepID=UPI00398A79A0
MKYTVLEGSENGKVWDWFYDRFLFKPSYYAKNWPSIEPSLTSRTYRFADYLFEDDFDGYEDWIHAGLKEVVSNDFLYALDWQHPCYKFHLNNYGDLPIGFFPDGDYYIFIDASLSNGVFTHPWEQSVCVFGDRLVEVLTKKFAAPFSQEFRRS